MFEFETILLLVKRLKVYEEIDKSRLSYLIALMFDRSVEQDKVDMFSSLLLKSTGGKQRTCDSFRVISGKTLVTFIWPAHGQEENIVVISRANTILFKKMQRALLMTLLGLIVVALVAAGIVAYLLWTEYFAWSLFERVFRVATRIAVCTLSAFIAALAITELLSLDVNRRFIHKLKWLRERILRAAESAFAETAESTLHLSETLRKSLACIKAQHLLTWGQMLRIKLPGL